MTDMTVAGLALEPGQRVTHVARAHIAGRQIEIPIIALQGVKPGPRVAVTAGIHGCEYVGIEAARRLGMSVDPQEMAGTLVVVPVANTTAYFARAIYTSGFDTTNINRVFPGKADGSPAEQLAHWLFQTVIAPSQFYIDMHGGDMIEALVPFVLAPETGDPHLDETCLGMATACGIERVIVSSVSGSTVAAATAAGIPAILPEIGSQGIWNEADVAAHMQSTVRVLHHLGLLAGEVPPSGNQRTYHTFAWIRSDADGLFHPSVGVGDHVQAGQDLGNVVDYFGNRMQAVSAAAAGEVVFLVTSLAINAGDPLLAIGAEDAAQSG